MICDLEMYEPLNVDGQTMEVDDAKTSYKNEDREKFLDSLLGQCLNPEKLKEKDKLSEKIKFKRHQLETATKQMSREKSEKSRIAKMTSALASGMSLKNSHNFRAKKQSKLSFKVKKQLKLFKLDKGEQLDFEKYKKINELWRAYAISCLSDGLPSGGGGGKGGQKGEEPPAISRLNEENVLSCLRQIDYHGCHLTVTRSSVKSLIGQAGLVLQDRKNVFVLLSKDNKIRYVPKPGNLFEFDVFG